MLILVTFALVLVASVALVIGFIQASLTPIYLSIACSVAAAATLVAFSRLSRGGGSRVVALPDEDDLAEPGAEAPPAHRAARPAPAPRPVPPAGRPGPASTPMASFEEEAPDADEAAWFDDDGSDGFEEESEGRADELPIAGYDRLQVPEILPLLDDLSPEELDAVRRAEEEGKGRTMVLNRIDAIVSGRSDRGAGAGGPGGSGPGMPRRNPARGNRAGSATGGSRHRPPRGDGDGTPS